MEAHAEHAGHAEHEHDHEPMPTEGRALDMVALSATLHCLTGCAIGEVVGVVVGTALGFSDWGTIALAVFLAFLFGYALTSVPLLRAGLALGAVIPIALASDTFSIATMEIVDNGILLIVPGAMEAGVGDVLFWGALSFALVIAFIFAVPVNRWLIKRGKGHTAVHETGIHGGPPVRLVAIGTVIAAIFGTTVLVTEAINGEDPHMDGGGGMAAAEEAEGDGGHDGEAAEHGTAEAGAEEADPIRGLAVSEGGLTLEMAGAELRAGEPGELRFTIVDDTGEPVRDYEVEHEREMHLILVRRDMSGFQHLHPTLGPDGAWATPVTVPDPGGYRVFADFSAGGERRTLGADLDVDGELRDRPFPSPKHVADAGDGYEVRLESEPSVAGEPSELAFSVTRDGEPVQVQPYLGADGHLVALREGDLAYLHTHPTEGGEGGPIEFSTDFPTAGRYALFLQFKHRGKVHTAEFGREVSR